ARGKRDLAAVPLDRDALRLLLDPGGGLLRPRLAAAERARDHARLPALRALGGVGAGERRAAARAGLCLARLLVGAVESQLRQQLRAARARLLRLARGDELVLDDHGEPLPSDSPSTQARLWRKCSSMPGYTEPLASRSVPSARPITSRCGKASGIRC